MKIVVYGICKDESANVAAFMAACHGADTVYLTDTGSADGTVELLGRLGAVVTVADIQPFRFDVARNRALAAVPHDVDVCVSLDLDDRPSKGWRAAIEAAWTGATNRLRYHMEWDLFTGQRYLADRIHARHGFQWELPVHERLVGPSVFADCGMRVIHCQNKHKDRSAYLPLSRLAAEENPTDAYVLNHLCSDTAATGDHLAAVRIASLAVQHATDEADTRVAMARARNLISAYTHSE